MIYLYFSRIFGVVADNLHREKQTNDKFARGTVAEAEIHSVAPSRLSFFMSTLILFALILSTFHSVIVTVKTCLNYGSY